MKVNTMVYFADVSFIQDSTLSKDHLGIMEAFQYAVKAVNEDLKHDKYIIEIKQRRNITEIDNRFLLTNQSLHRIQAIYKAQKNLGISSFSLRPQKITNINDSYAVLRGVDRNRFCDTDYYHHQFTCNMRIILDLSSSEAYNLTLEQVYNVIGLTGKVTFDNNGQRKDYTLEFHQMGYKSTLKKETDLALASLTITGIRQRVVDFTTPFMQMGISIMYKKPDKQKPGAFSFMDPLNKIVWICVMIGFLAVSLVLFFVGRWSSYEWRVIENSRDRDQSNTFTFSNTL